MRKFSVFMATLIFVAAWTAVYAQTTQNAPTIVTPSQLKWTTAGLPKGMSMATVSGDPNGTGYYVQRLKLAPGSQFPPHTHGKTEMVTVLSGTLWAGIGKKFDQSKMKPLPAGSFVVMPAGVPHYVMAKDDVVIEITGMGPSTTSMIGGGNMSM